MSSHVNSERKSDNRLTAGKENLQSLLYVEDNLSQFVNQYHLKYLLRCFQKLFQMNHDLSRPIECAKPPVDYVVFYSANKDELEILKPFKKIQLKI